MSLNRRRHANVVPLASIATWIVVAAFAGSTGVYYVYCKNQLHITGATIKRLERDLDRLRLQDEELRASIVLHSSYPALKRLLDMGFMKLVRITDDRIIRVDAPAVPAEDELRGVSNERSGE
jgi:hypothetical protein